MMDTRREFIKKAGILSGLTGMQSLIPGSIQKAFAIEPAAGSTWKDAEHIVILMQENRSFDHCYGTLRGVRGFNDPRAIKLPNGNPVWLQTDETGRSYAPFHLDIKDTRATWMNSLPHTWPDQVNARNDGRFDQWLPQKKSNIDEYAAIPLTMGYYNRQDIPFYYALADAFTVCDQHFCSSLTGTTPNRLFFWTGTIRAEQNENSRALVWNDDADYESLHWKTFPEILEENNISWKVYQNELSVDVGFTDEEGAWLANFGDNPMEFFARYNVKLHNKHLDQLNARIKELPSEINSLQKKLVSIPQNSPAGNDILIKIEEKKKELSALQQEFNTRNQEKFNRLSSFDKGLHRKAFVTNANDPNYHFLEEISYEDGDRKRELKIPKGDLFHQFRSDAKSGNLPTVSWLIAPENLSDHPASAWYGAWYVSEVMDILTRDPELWKKTIFILTYDENDGYFDHVPPFVAPQSGNEETGKASGNLDTRVEYVTHQQEKERNGFPVAFNRASPIGLGYRVPMVVASPWSRGGFVNSEVFDHTSTIQFLENFLSVKTKKMIRTDKISDWRRSVCGDLTSVFRPASENSAAGLAFLQKNSFIESIYNAKFRKLPDGYKALSDTEISEMQADPYHSPFMPVQETGVKPSNGLNYQLYADGKMNTDKTSFVIRFESGSRFFGKKALGSPFNVYAPGKYLQTENGSTGFKKLRTWAFAVRASEHLEFSWPIVNFEKQIYQLQVYGPNGFLREYKGSAADQPVDIICEYDQETLLMGKPGFKLEFRISMNSRTSEARTLVISDNAYQSGALKIILDSQKNSVQIVPIDLSKQWGWYDFTVRIEGDEIFERRYAGRVETGETGFTDPFMGRVVQKAVV